MSYRKHYGIKSSYIHKEYEMKNFGCNENLLRFELRGGGLLKKLDQ
uniref:Uncharacterized protein n=1 Tax=Trichinella nativa TaxID=6335 RepID=A0A0V1KIG1_9BILA